MDNMSIPHPCDGELYARWTDADFLVKACAAEEVLYRQAGYGDVPDMGES